MRAFIKDRTTFATKSHNLVLDYALKYSIYDTVSCVTIQTPATLPGEGDILYMENGFFGIIQAISTEEGKTQLDVNQIISLLERNMFYTPAPFTYLEDYLAQLVQENFTQCPDVFYALPYLTAQAVTHTAAQMNPDTENNIFSVKSYAAKMRRLYNIFCEWGISRDTLTLQIARRVKVTKNIDFSNPLYVVTSQDFSQKTVSKITSYCEENGEMKTWVLMEDGSITDTTPAAGRIRGEWVPLTVAKAEDVEDSVRDEFAKNEFSHKIEFQAPKSRGFSLYDPLKIKLDNRIFSSYVSGVTEEQHSDIVTVQCGELQMQYPYLNLL